MLGIRIYRDHVVCRHEELRHPEKNLPLYSISKMKDALEEPLITSMNAAMEYIKQKDPYDIGERVDAYGRKKKNFSKRTGRRARGTEYLEARYGNYET